MSPAARRAKLPAPDSGRAGGHEPESGASTITILAPVLDRPHRVRSIVQSLEGTAAFTSMRIVFLCSPEDWDERKAILDVEDEWKSDGQSLKVESVIVPWEPGPGDYARKINHGSVRARAAGSRFVLLAADDLHFHPGWAERALATYLETGACVIGTNDLGNTRVTSGNHATHPLVHLDYLECGTIDEPDCGRLLAEVYHHNFVDTEFIETAKIRGTFVAALDSHVEHIHHLWGKAPDDETYRIGSRTFPADQVLFARRRQLWEDPK